MQNDFYNSELRVPEEVLKLAKLTPNVLKQYSLLDSRGKNFLIHSFTDIGMRDPFPDDDAVLKGAVDDVIYSRGIPQILEDDVYPLSRYVEGRSPDSIYIPSQ